MMSDINLFGKPGIQERIQKLEPLSEPDRQEKGEGGGEGRFRTFPTEEFLAAVLALAIGWLAWWYFSLTSNVRSEVKEYTPREFMTKSSSGQGNAGDFDMNESR